MNEPSFSPLSNSPRVLSSQIHDLHFNYYYLCVCVHVCMHTGLYDLLSPFSFAYMYMCLGLSTWIGQPMGEPLEETNSHSLSKHWPFHLDEVTLRLDVGPCGISPAHVGMSTSIIILLVLFRQPNYWELMGVAPLSYREDTIL